MADSIVTEVEAPDVTEVSTPTVTDVARTEATASTPLVAVPKVEEGETVEGYTPTFNDATRTVLYVVCAILGLLGAVATIVSVSTNAPAWLTIGSAICGFIAPYVANVFGVAYNPVRVNSK